MDMYSYEWIPSAQPELSKLLDAHGAKVLRACVDGTTTAPVLAKCTNMQVLDFATRPDEVRFLPPVAAKPRVLGAILTRVCRSITSSCLKSRRRTRRWRRSTFQACMCGVGSQQSASASERCVLTLDRRVAHWQPSVARDDNVVFFDELDPTRFPALHTITVPNRNLWPTTQ